MTKTAHLHSSQPIEISKTESSYVNSCACRNPRTGPVRFPHRVIRCILWCTSRNVIGKCVLLYLCCLWRTKFNCNVYLFKLQVSTYTDDRKILSLIWAYFLSLSNKFGIPLLKHSVSILVHQKLGAVPTVDFDKYTFFYFLY